MMKKKHMLSILTMIVAVSMMAAAVYAEGGKLETDSEAGIEFTAGEAPGIVPPDESTPGIKSATLNFGIRELATSVATYLSTDAGVGISDDEKYAGLVVANPRNNLDWTVTVTISDFKESGQVTMQGFELYLLGQEDVVGNFNEKPIYPATSDKLKANGDEVLVLAPAEGYNAGTFGVNYAGRLVVPLGSARVGEAQATMVWNFVTAA